MYRQKRDIYMASQMENLALSRYTILSHHSSVWSRDNPPTMISPSSSNHPSHS